jgi:hypothetical protein
MDGRLIFGYILRYTSRRLPHRNLYYDTTLLRNTHNHPLTQTRPGNRTKRTTKQPSPSSSQPKR